MNIKVKAAMDAAVVVLSCAAVSAGFVLSLQYLPYVALALVVGILYWVAYKLCLGQIEAENLIKESNEKIAKIKEGR
jgi:hypothetical protein